MKWLHALIFPKTVCDEKDAKQKTFIHRDLKSANLMLDPIQGLSNEEPRRYTLRIIDLGLGRYKNMNQGQRGMETVDISTAMMSGCGSQLWMAPEIVNGKIYNEKVDVFSYSMCLLEMITNKLPWSDFPSAGLACSRGNRPLNQLKRDRNVGGWSVEEKEFLCDLVIECWEQQPTSRPSFEGIYTQLETFQKDNGYDNLFNKVDNSQNGGQPDVKPDVKPDVNQDLPDVKQDLSVVNSGIHTINNVIIDIYSYNQTVYSAINLDFNDGFQSNNITCITFLNKLIIEEKLHMDIQYR